VKGRSLEHISRGGDSILSASSSKRGKETSSVGALLEAIKDVDSKSEEREPSLSETQLSLSQVTSFDSVTPMKTEDVNAVLLRSDSYY